METKTADQNVEITQDADIVETDETNKQASTKLIWLAVFILASVQAGLFWLWDQQNSVHESVHQQLTVTKSPAADNAKWQQELQALETTVQTSLSSLDSAQQALAVTIKEVGESQQLSRGDVEHYWALAEVEYLLNVANQRLLLANDVAGASEVLAMVDGRIEALSDYRLHPLRALLVDEQLALASVLKVDVNGMALKLQSALDKVDTLQVLMAAPQADNGDDETALSMDNWQGAFGQAWQEVKSLVVIRQQQDGAAAVLVPEQRYFLYQNLRLKLETARLALLSGQSAVFEASLQAATQWLEQYFVGEEQAALLALVAELQAINTHVSVPDISASLTWIKGFER